MPPARSKSRRQARPADPARLAAYAVVHAVSTRDAYANLALSATLRERGLAGRDAGFVTELANGTLRRRATYDAVVDRCVNRPLHELDTEVLDVLRLGTHQLLGMRVPAHAAVATSVDLAREVAGVGPSMLVNAVLRKVTAHDLDGWLAQVAPAYDDDPLGHLAVVHAHPRWIAAAMKDALGDAAAETADALAADNEPARVTLAAWPGRSTVDELRAGGAEPGRWSPYAAVLGEGDPGTLDAVAEGRAGVQDEGSQLVALALARVPLDGRDARWLDLCAGPGGKSALLAGLAAERSARLLAVERQPHRAAMVRRALAGGPGVLGTLIADGTRPPWQQGSFDRVLVDVPCTGLGALRRRPDARWRRVPEDVDSLRPLQTALLEAALDSVRPGGVVAYVTCSPHLGETRAVVAAVLAGRHDIEHLDARPYLPGVPDLGAGPDIQLWPHRHHTDAMYLALLRRV